MKKYYVLSMESFLNTFTAMDAAETMSFSCEVQGQPDIFTGVNSGDALFIYRKNPISKINMYLEVLGKTSNKVQLNKILEVAGGISGAVVGKDVEREILTEIDEKKFHEIYRLLVDSISCGEMITAGNAGSSRITNAENVLLYGVPGVGKSHEIQKKYCSDAARMARVVFHPDYTYSDFVGQILPRVDAGQLKYEFAPGPFTRMMELAWKNPEKEFFLVIEEINRGNAPAIFGEIFQLLDRKTGDSHRYDPSEYGESEYSITNYDVAAIVYKDEKHEVRIPSNLWILATMNTADQNVFTLDTAFQRRWNMRYMKNDVWAAGHANDKVEGTRIQWGAFAAVINDLIVDSRTDMASSEDKRLGAYFVRRKELAADKFPEKVLKYLWDDAFKMDRERVFDEQLQTLEQVIEAYEDADTDKLKAVLKSEVYQKMQQQMEQRTRQQSEQQPGRQLEQQPEQQLEQQPGQPEEPERQPEQSGTADL